MAAPDEEELVLRAADELLAQDDATTLKDPTKRQQHHRRLSSTASAGHIPLHSVPTANSLPAAPRDLVASLTVLVCVSTLATHQLPLIAQHSKSLLLAFPFLHYGSLGLLGVGLGYWRPRGAFGKGVKGGIELGRGGERANRKVMALAGAFSALSMILRLWTTRRNDNRLCEVIDLFVLPTILLILPYLSPRPPLGSPLHSPIPSVFANTIVLTTFMAGFCLIGIYGSSAKLLLAILRLPFEASALLLLKEGLSDEGRIGEFLMGSVAAATITSLASVPLTWLVPLESIFPAPSIFAVLLTLASSIGSQIALLFALYLFTSPLTSSGTLFARNFLLLCLATLGGDGFAIQDNWLQVIFVYAVGTAAIAWSDSEVSSSVRGISSQKGSQSASNTGYSLLNANGPAGNGLSSSPNLSNPSSPSLHPSTPPALGNRKSSSERIPQSTSASSASFLPQSPLLALVPFIPLIIHLLQPPASNIPPLTHACSLLPYSLRAAICPITAIPLDMSKNNVDIVISYYSEDLPHVKEHLDGMRKLPFVMERDERVVVYNKGPLSEEEIRQGMELLEHDEVVPLDNVGREGETYLKHILLHYNDTISSSPYPLPASNSSDDRASSHLRRKTLAAHTFFLQPHLAWPWVAAPRMQLVGPDTGFAHLGPLIDADCGKDLKVNVEFPIYTELFGIFTGSLCPPGGQTMAWSAQFVASRKRILANPYHKYSYVDELMSAPADHWIHNMWGPNESGGPSNPAFGHSVERAWPIVFDCWDPRFGKECTDDVMDRDKCTCLDEDVSQ